MKKVLIAVMAMGLMATHAMAWVGKVDRVQVNANGTMFIVVKNGAGDLIKRALPEDADVRKAMLAAAMTAYSTKSTVNVVKDATIWTQFVLWTE